MENVSDSINKIYILQNYRKMFTLQIKLLCIWVRTNTNNYTRVYFECKYKHSR